MEKVKVLFLALTIGIIFIPLSIFLKRFSTIEAYEKPKVTFDPLVCYKCEDCPCTFTLDDGIDYRISRKDKSVCELPEDKVSETIRKGYRIHTSYLDIKDYVEFEDCVQWYSLHPSTF